MRFHPEGILIDLSENRAAVASASALAESCKTGRILESKAILCDQEHNLIVDLNGIRGIIPRDEGAIGIREGNVRDIAIISRVNRPVCFVIEELFTASDGNATAILSRRKAQELCHRHFISRLLPGDILDARVTHLEPFGAFCDIGCGIVALLPIDAISISRINHPKERFCTDMRIRAVVRQIENGRITLSHKELLGTWEENAACFCPGETVRGVIRSVESYGVFVELAPNLAGLAEYKADAQPGLTASVFIKSILPDKMKIKLIIIDVFDEEPVPEPPHYFLQSGHLDCFFYSPPGCTKQIVSEFS